MLWSRIKPGLAGTRGIVRWGPLTIDAGERRARKGGRPVELSPLLWRLLMALVERPGQLVTRAELKRHLWPYAVRIDTERRLNTAMRALRAALGDDADAPRLIETVRGSGYRWIGASGLPRHAAALSLAAWTLLAGALFVVQPEPSPFHSVAAMIEAQSALDAWRDAPTRQSLTRATQRLDAARVGLGPTPALLVMEAELALGGRWDWAAAERNYRTALALDRENVDVRLGLAWLESSRGNQEAALEQVERLLGRAVMAGERRASLGWLLIRLRRPELALATCRSLTTVNGLSCSHTAAWNAGDPVQARTFALQLMRQKADVASIRAVERLPPSDAYRAFLRWRAEHFLPQDAAAFHRAQILAEAGFHERALAALERSVAAREPYAVKIASTPSFANLAGNARFAVLRRTVGA